MEIVEGPAFQTWMNGLRDRKSRARILDRLVRLTEGHLGDTKSLGNGVHELRCHFGPGYRIYFIGRGDEVIILLCGGDKGSQDRDVAQAKRLAKYWSD